MSKTVITIERQFGSGGYEIGKKLSEKLGFKFYDRELLAHAAQESGICEELFEHYDEKPTNSLLYSLVMGAYPPGFTDIPINHKVSQMQFETIKKIASQESCIIIGRCADSVLEGEKGVIRLFFHADLEKRIIRVMEDKNVNREKAKEMITKTDKNRASYYNYYSNSKWGDARSYNLCMNSLEIGTDNCVEIIAKYIEGTKKI